MGAGAAVKPENARYMALDSAQGIKRLLGDWNALRERRYCGDMTDKIGGRENECLGWGF